MIRFLAMVGLLAAPPQPTTKPCFTADEMRDMVIVAIPAAMDAAIPRCRASLDPNAFIMTDAGRAFVARVRADAVARQSRVIASWQRVRGTYGLSPERSDSEAMAAIYSSFVKAIGSIKSDQCSDLNSFIEAIAPLPPSNIGSAIAATYGLVVHAKDGVLCRP